jgi:type VI secretion system (T6SS) effector TldE1-like protein
MTCIESRSEYEPYGPRRLPRSVLPQNAFVGVALTCVAFAGAWLLCSFLPWAGGDRAEAMQEVLVARSDPAASLFDSRFYLGSASASLSPSVAPRWYNPTSLASLPSPVPISQEREAPEQSHEFALHTPAPHSADLQSRRQGKPPREDSGQPAQAVATAAAEPSIFERIFGKRPSSVFEKLYGPTPARVTLAYAAPEAGAVYAGQPVTPAGRYDRQTAVYDITARVVYLPDGTTLEAHSGYGDRLDDPYSAGIRSRGVTPPNVYDLQLREAPFHGVRALRLIPEDQAKVFGRSGLLAHTYMLGPNGDSNGCVSFRDYEAFLRAYTSHEITKLAVVTSVD